MAAGGGTETGGAELPPELLDAEFPAPFDVLPPDVPFAEGEPLPGALPELPFEELPLAVEPARVAPLELAPLFGAGELGWSDPMPVVLPEFDVARREPDPADPTAPSEPVALPSSARPPQAAANAQTTHPISHRSRRMTPSF